MVALSPMVVASLYAVQGRMEFPSVAISDIARQPVTHSSMNRRVKQFVYAPVDGIDPASRAIHRGYPLTWKNPVAIWLQ
jgi:hypothetical protein